MALVKSKLQFIRGTAAQANAYTPLAGEPVFTIDTTGDPGEEVTTVSLRIGDGTLAGGHSFPSLATVNSLISNAFTSVVATDAAYGAVKLSDAVDGTETAASGG